MSRIGNSNDIESGAAVPGKWEAINNVLEFFVGMIKMFWN